MTNWAFNWLTFPTGYDENDSYYVQIPRAIVPLLTGTLIAQWEQREPWDTDSDHEQGMQAAYLLQERLVTGLNMNIDIWSRAHPSHRLYWADSYLAVGDSIVEGYEMPPNEDGLQGYPTNLYRRLRDVYSGLVHTNLGIAGESSVSIQTSGQLDDAVLLLQAAEAAGEMTLVTLTLGANDLFAALPPPVGTFASPAAQLNSYETAMQTVVIPALRNASPRSRLVMMTYYSPWPGLWMPGYGEFSDQWVPPLNRAIRRLCENFGLMCVEIEPVFRNREADYIYVRRPYNAWDVADYGQNFDPHPRPAGHQAIADEFFNTINAPYLLSVTVDEDEDMLGSVKLWPLNSDPGDGWMLCDGRAINRATYADLYTLIGDTFGAGDGSTTFNLPNQTATSAGLYYIIKVSPL
jgi:lysophospholipase L1-like esterase